jgi:predicted NUDIX family NTP pyrophosphohydrolase
MKASAGLLIHRRRETIEVLLVHPGGPFWVRKDDHAWSIPKGEYEGDEDPETAARREFAEELGSPAPEGTWIDLGEVRQPSGKLVRAWAAEGDFDPADLVSNTFELEWPRGSGRTHEYPEVDRADWFDLPTARRKLHKGQAPFIDAFMSAVETRK